MPCWRKRSTPRAPCVILNESLIRKHATLWTLVLATLPLLGWWMYGLFDLDEGFYAAVVSEMNRRGEWITPYYNGHPWFEKPILLYWLAKPSLALFGEAVGPRLPDVLANIATYSMVYWFCQRRFDKRVAFYATLVLATSPLVVGLGRMMMTDPILMACLTGAFLSFWESIEGEPRWRIASAIFLGLGMLAKGPVVGVLFLPVVGWIYWRRPSTRQYFKGGWFIGIVVFVLVVGSWYLPAYLANGHTFVQDFLITQNIGRFAGGSAGDQAHTVTGLAGLLYYPVIILITYLPWSGFLPKYWKIAEDRPLNSFLKAWFLAVLIFFTITKAKLPHYMLPLSAPLAILIGQGLAARRITRKYTIAWPLGALVFIIFLANFGFGVYYRGADLGRFELPSDHVEVHAIARYVRSHASPNDLVAEFKIGRQQKSLGTISLENVGKTEIKIQETLHPSVLLYLDRTALETDSWSEILARKSKVWVITRSNRIGPEEEASAQGRLHRVDVPTGKDRFRLYVLDPVPN